MADQVNYLGWFLRRITPALGPRPLDGKPHWGSSFTPDGSPLEYSLNWKQKTHRQTVRFTIEPVGEAAGSAADILNQLAAKDALTGMTDEVPGLDLQRFILLSSETGVPNEAGQEVLAKLPSGHPKVLTLLAFDLEGGNIVAKAYYNPGPKALLTGKPTKAIVFDAIRKCNGPQGSYSAGVQVLDDYLASYSAAEQPQVFLLANDCVVDSPASRLKVYVSTPITTLAAASKAITLKGRLSGPAIEPVVNAVEEFWEHLFGLSSTDAVTQDREVLPPDSRGVLVYEIRPTIAGSKDADVEVKLHMPPSWLGNTDAEVCKVLSSWFEKHGHPELASSYQQKLVSAL
ncbi:hypothetical protein SLS53_003072 [Cytospora paraplurivora]|uniref:Aromatic prenyltransferase n=1 Tax=Cytospora paraplurivora TaxID=2898453 RepID=A0AAN9UF89_9PEZI